MIETVRVTGISLRDLTMAPKFDLRFHCYDAQGEALPGLGGFLRQDATAARPEWTVLADSLIATGTALGEKWARLCDDYTAEAGAVGVVGIDMQRYPGNQGHGLNVRLVRPGDTLEGAMLVTIAWAQPDRIRHNQKRWIDDADMTDDLNADIEALFTKAEELALVVNQSRIIRKVEKSWRRNSTSS